MCDDTTIFCDGNYVRLKAVWKSKAKQEGRGSDCSYRPRNKKIERFVCIQPISKRGSTTLKTQKNWKVHYLDRS